MSANLENLQRTADIPGATQIPAVEPVQSIWSPPKLYTGGDYARFYTDYYRVEDNDSPVECRAAMIEQIAPIVYSLPHGTLTLDLGAGKQVLESEMFDKYGYPEAGILTVDVADVGIDQLMASHGPRITQIQTDATKLPLLDGSVSVAWSVLAFDFFEPREEAVEELRRVLEPGAPVFMALHNPNTLLTFDIDRALSTSNRRIAKKRRWGREISKAALLENDTLRQQVAMRDGGRYFTSADQIEEFFGSRGFQVDAVALTERKRIEEDTWWDVRLTKSEGGEN